MGFDGNFADHCGRGPRGWVDGGGGGDCSQWPRNEEYTSSIGFFVIFYDWGRVNLINRFSCLGYCVHELFGIICECDFYELDSVTFSSLLLKCINTNIYQSDAVTQCIMRKYINMMIAKNTNKYWNISLARGVARIMPTDFKTTTLLQMQFNYNSK